MDHYSWGGKQHYIGDPKTTNEMHAKATYTDWDFENIWGRNDTINDGYPYLRCFYDSIIPDSPDPYFTVTFRDWDGAVLKTEQVEQGRSATAPADPTREGYTFKGWDKDFSNVQSDLTVTAQYDKNIVYFTVTFQDWDGAVLKTEQVEQGKSATAPASPTREGYTFKGWDKDFSNVQSDLTVIAQYEQNAPEPIYYTVTFQDWNGTVLKTEQVEQGRSATAPAAPTREGYTFKGWDKDFSNVQSNLTVTALYKQNVVEHEPITVRLDPQSCSSWYSVYLYAWDNNQQQPAGGWPGTKVSKDNDGWWSYTFDSKLTKVNIIWTNGSGDQTVDITGVTVSTCYKLNATTGNKITVTVVDCPADVQPVYFTVTFQDWDGTVLKTEQVEQGKSATAPADPTREGYTFKGWDKDFSNVQNDLTVTAQYTRDIVYFTVSFYDWDGTELHVEQVEQGKDAVGPAVNPTREGYTFIGWSKPITNIQSNLIVIAQYKENAVYFTVNFIDWDGTLLKSEEVEKSKSATAPADPVREGYTFKGWDKDFSNVQSDLTVTALYEQNVVEPTYFTVTFLDWDGTVLKTEQVEQGKSATAPAAPTREGYTFKGWDKDFSNVQSDLTVTALYEQNAVEHEPITVRLNPQSCLNWSNVYLYAWDANINQPAGEWPGTKVGKDGQGWWIYTFDSKFTNVNIIWTNGTGDQTIDITNVTQSTCYTLDSAIGNKITVTVVGCYATDVEDVPMDNASKAMKVIKNNTLYIILPDGKTYTIMGQKVK